MATLSRGRIALTRTPMSEETKTTSIFIDPPSGWKYGFPKQAPATLREMNGDDLNEWLLRNGYPEEEINYWRKSPKYSSVPCKFFEVRSET